MDATEKQSTPKIAKIRKRPVDRESVRRLLGILDAAAKKLSTVLAAMDLDNWNGSITFDGGNIGEKHIGRINKWASDVVDHYAECDKRPESPKPKAKRRPKKK